MGRKSTVFVAFVVFVACGLRPVDCAPSWNIEPSDPLYVLENQEASFHWQYDSGGFSLQEIKWKVTTTGGTIIMASESNVGNFATNPSYSGNTRVTRSNTGNAAINLRDVKISDNGQYECDVDFGGFNAINHRTNLVVVVRPQITERTADVTLEEGQGQVLKCTATGNPTPSITWKKDSVKLPPGDPSSTEHVITNAQRKDKGKYTCQASVVAGNLGPYTESYSVQVTVRYKPQIVVPPQNTTLDEGSAAQFDCEADGNPDVATYTWYDKNNNRISSGVSRHTITTSNKISTLRITNVGKDDAGEYKCSGINALGEGKPASGFLTVNYKPTTVTVTPSPAGDRDQGDDVTFTCESDGFPSPSYIWKHNGADFNPVQDKKKLSFFNLDKNRAGNYTCIASNRLGSKQHLVVLNVKYAPEETQFSTGTPNSQVIQGTKVTLTCTAEGYPPPRYDIRRNNAVAESDVSPGIHTIGSVQLSDDGVTFDCVARNEKGSGQTQSLVLTVLVPPTFKTSPPGQPQTKTENQNTSYSCHAQGKPAPKIIWQLNGHNLTNTAPYVITATSVAQGDKTIDTQGNLNIVGITWRQNGTFKCIATNSAGTKSSSTELTVRHRPVVKTEADHPKNKTVETDESVEFKCNPVGNPSTTQYQWQFEGKNVTVPISGSSGTRYSVNKATTANEGRYSCLGYNDLGWGPPADAYLLIKAPPQIVDHTPTGKRINETKNVTLFCRVIGVPTPRVTWTKIGGSRDLHVGEEFTIHNAAESDQGTYKCTARNEKGTVSKEIQLIVQVRPTILTSTPEATQVPDENGEAQMTCTVKGDPLPVLSWKRGSLNSRELQQGDPRVKEIVFQTETSVLKVAVDSPGEKYYCLAVNALGKDDQEYAIRRKGPPDKPINVEVRGIMVDKATTVNVNVSWTPGYDGGYPQTFKVKYRETELNGPFTTSDASNTPIRTMFVVTGLRPETEYEFRVLGTNVRGDGELSNSELFTTPKSAEPPPRATVSVKRTGEDVAVVTWKVHDNKVRFVDVQYRQLDGIWQTAASNLSPAQEEYTVTGLEKDTTYEFRLLLKEQKASAGEAVHFGSKVGPLSTPVEPSSGALSQNAMIAIIAAVAGVLLIALVILVLCCFRRRKKYRGDQPVEMSQTEGYPYQGYAAGGPADVNHGTSRRSYGLESVEDDPFIEAHSASQQSMAFSETGKRKPNNVNYGYMSQGSRLARNARLTQSTGELEGVGYPARSPQRDFNTLPPYHDPPTFEEAMRQSGRKPRTRKSTGDLTDGRSTADNPGRQSGRRARPSRPVDDPTDSSDAEPRYRRRPTPAVRALDSDDEPRYASGHTRRAPPIPAAGVEPRGAPDPEVPYAKPIKKPKPARVMRAEPAIEQLRPPPTYGHPAWRSPPAKGWPPPQYTPEDRSLERGFDPRRVAPPEEGSGPMVTDLDLDDPIGPPDPPPPLLDDELENRHPEPPVFMRDERGPRSSRGSGYEPPSHRSSQPYINSQGQLVRPSSSRPDLRASSHSLQRPPEPEVPSNQPQPEANGPEVNYVSYLV